VHAQPAAPATPAPAPAAAGAPASAALPLSDSLQGAAKQAYESAKLLATNKDFDGALAEFRQAYTYSKDPRLLFNMAICQKELHHYAKMRVFLDQYLHDGVGVASPESLASAQDALTAIKPLVAALQLKVSEPGAEVTVDGEVVGTSPVMERVSVDLGRHTISVKKSGFDPHEQTLETPGGTEAVVQITLVAQKHQAQLVVSAGPGATVIIDGSMMGQGGRFDGAVASGAHDVSVTAQGKRPYKAQVELRDGETRTLQVTLEDEEQRSGGSAWPWVIGGAVVAAGAAVGGYFLLKPGDTTTPVPAGKLTTVNLMVFRP
jgi:hypothetical protein